MKDAYAVLGLAPGATSDEIRAAYRSAVIATHPDVRPNDTLAHNRMIELTEAYRVLQHPASSPLQSTPSCGSESVLRYAAAPATSALARQLKSFRWAASATARAGMLVLA